VRARSGGLPGVPARGGQKQQGMTMRTDVSFEAEGVALNGWLYRPQSDEPAPLIIMTHGWGAVKEMFLELYGQAFAAAGFATLIYDHRNFGTSAGEPRQEVDPWQQATDYRHAISFGQTIEGVDPSRIGLWGTSFSGGHVLAVAALDRRVKCVVAQCPTISGYRNFLRRNPGDGVRTMRDRFDKDRRTRFLGGDPVRIPQVLDLELTGGSEDNFGPWGNDAAAFFGHMRSDRLETWRNELTLRSVEAYSEYEPGELIARIGPTPLLMIIGDADAMTPTDEALEAYSRAREPKRLVLVSGGHFDLYGPARGVAMAETLKWYKEYL
jgi:uncharacterized protein